MDKGSKIKIGLILIVSLIYLIVIFSDNYYIADWFSTDDAFYYFKTADNIANGFGSTFDGISKTNGYHPLWMIILIPIFFFSKYGLFVPLRLIILTQFVLAVFTIVIVFNYLREHLPLYLSATAALMWVLLIPIFEVASNGTESALNGFAITLFWVTFSRFLTNIDDQKYKLKKIGLLGITAAVVIFSRLDNVFLIFVFGIWLGLTYLQEHHWVFSVDQIKDLVVIEFGYFFPSAFLLSLYLVWNKVTIGTLMPLSGQIKKYWGELSNTVYGSRVNGIGEFLGEIFSRDQGPWGLFFQPYWQVIDSFEVSYLYGTKIVSLGVILVTAASLLVGFIISKNWKHTLQRIFTWSVIPLFLGTFAHFSYYKIFGYLAPRAWYWVGGSIFVVILLVIVLENIFLSFSGFNEIFKNILTVSVVILIGIFILRPHLVSSIRRLTNRSPEIHPYIMISSWLEEHTNPGSIVGMTGAGSTAFFVNDRIIMNLDGLVNGQEYFDDLKNGSASKYLEQNNVMYVYGNQYILLQTDPYQENFQSLLEQSEITGEFGNKFILWELDYTGVE